MSMELPSEQLGLDGDHIWRYRSRRGVGQTSVTGRKGDDQRLWSAEHVILGYLGIYRCFFHPKRIRRENDQRFPKDA